jgi:hypothetical protein
MQVAQATINDARQSAEHHWLETLLSELTSARRDIELLQHLEQEHNRAGWLEQELAAARREIEAQAALGAKASDDASQPKPASESSAVELQKIVQDERRRVGRLEQDLAAARRDLETQTALATKASEEGSRLKQASERSAAEMQKILQEERGRSSRLEQDLAAARHDVEAQTALAAKATDEAQWRNQAAEAGAAELRQSMQKERERADALAHELSMTRSAIYAYEAQARKAADEAAELRQAAANGAPSLHKSAQDERERAERLAQDLAAARRDVETQTALAAKASEEASRLKQASVRRAAEVQKSLQKERERSSQLEEGLAAARRGSEAQAALAAKASEEGSRLKEAGERSAAGLQKSLQEERGRSAALEQDLAAARRDVEAQTALVAKATDQLLRRNRTMEAGAAELRRSMQKEHERTSTLAQDRSMTWSSIYAYEAQARKAGDEAAELMQAAANSVPSPRKSAQSEPDPPTQDLVVAYRVGPNIATLDSTARGKPVEENARPVADRTPGRDGRGDAQPNSEQAVVAARLVARASTLLGHGDLGAARIVLERAIEMGSAQANFSLAETYDPLILAKRGAYGTRGDASKAQDLYAKAEAAGIKEAKARFEALHP